MSREWLAIVGVAPGRGIHWGADRHPNACQNPRTLTRGEARRQQSVIDFARHGKAVEHRWRQEKPGIVFKTIRRGVNVAFRGGDDAVAVLVDARDFGGVGIEQPSLKLSDVRLERSPPLVDIEINLVREAARNTALAEFPLRVDVGVKFVGIARKVRVVTDVLWLVRYTPRSRAGNDRLQLPDLAVLKRVWSLPEIVWEAPRKGQFIKRVDPVGAEVVELPIGMDIRLLHGVVSAHALVNGDNIGLQVGEAVGGAGEVRGLAVEGEDIPWHVVAGPHSLEDIRVLLGDHSELRVAVGASRGDGGDRDVVDHPPFIPTALVVDDEHWGNVGENIDERARIRRIGRKTGLGLQDDADGAERWQPAVSPGDGQLYVSVIHPRDYGSKHVGFETGGVQQVILKQLTGPVGLGERLHRQVGMRSVGQLSQPVLQRIG